MISQNNNSSPSGAALPSQMCRGSDAILSFRNVCSS